MQLFNQSHPSWPWFLGTLLTTGGGVCTGFHYIVKGQLHPVIRDVDQVVKNTQEINNNQHRLELNQQHLELNQQQLAQSMDRMEKNSAAAFDRLSENLQRLQTAKQ